MHMWSRKWSDRFFRICQEVASWSKDPSTHVGAIAVGDAQQILAEGFNGLPRGVRDLPERMERPQKYEFTIHAEANVVAHAARAVLTGSTVYCTHCCCSQCAGLLINSGVARVVLGNGATSMPAEKFYAALIMFEEAGVLVMDSNGDKIDADTFASTAGSAAAKL